MWSADFKVTRPSYYSSASQTLEDVLLAAERPTLPARRLGGRAGTSVVTISGLSSDRNGEILAVLSPDYRVTGAWRSCPASQSPGGTMNRSLEGGRADARGLIAGLEYLTPVTTL